MRIEATGTLTPPTLYSLTLVSQPAGSSIFYINNQQTSSGSFFASQVEIKAVPYYGNTFLHWKNGTGNIISTDNPYTITLDKDSVIYAEFYVPPPNLNDGLVAYYPLDGNANDISGFDNHGQIFGGVTPAPDRHGNAGGAMSFGNNRYIMVPHAPQINDLVDNYSFSVWTTRNGNADLSLLCKSA